MWCDFGRSMGFCVERRKRKSRSRDRGYGRERSTERDVQTKVSELTLSVKKAKK